MQHISHVSRSTRISAESVEKLKVSSVDQLMEINQGLTKSEWGTCNRVIREYPDLINSEIPVAWYCKAFYKVGENEFRRLADMSRKPTIKHPSRYFSTLLKKEIL